MFSEQDKKRCFSPTGTNCFMAANNAASYSRVVEMSAAKPQGTTLCAGVKHGSVWNKSIV